MKSNAKYVFFLLLLLHLQVFSQVRPDPAYQVFITDTSSYTFNYGYDVKGIFFAPDLHVNITSDIEHLKYLEKVRIYHNSSIENVDEAYTRLPNLREISLSTTADQPFPDVTIERLLSNPNIRTAYFNMPISDFAWEQICKMPNLEHLSVEVHDPTVFKNCSALKKLNSLSISNSDNSDFPIGIFDITSLDSLVLADWDQIPEGMGALKNLKYLRMYHSDESEISLPADIAKLASLNILLSGNLSPQSFEYIGELRSLETLVLTSYIKKIPANWKNLISLKRLELCTPQLDSLPHFMGKWSELQILNISSFKLRALPKSISELKHLKHLHISTSNIPSFEISPFRDDKVTYPRPFDYFKGEPSKYENKKEDNRIGLKSLKGSIEGCDSLELIFIATSKLKDASPLASCKMLKYIVLPSNEIERFDFDASQLPNLKYISMPKNNLKHFNFNLATFQDLEKIDLSYNQIKKCGQIYLPRSLKWLFLKHNQITSFPKFETLPDSLDFLSLIENRITKLPQISGQWKGIRYIGIRDNLIPEEMQIKEFEGTKLGYW